ncbi:hypothetical protein [Pseudonocardia lacus]|uniref:hypothetical protein n=1 Tax=Pseudonocardia lacus TaxID=2835865 RepID=UPI001BDBC50F|nr:hypothetical protein [Pseudonocardia lacus]
MGTATVDEARFASVREREQVVLALVAHQVADLARTIPYLVADVRRRLGEVAGPGEADVVIDLSAVPPAPACAPLLLLFRLVRRLVGPAARVLVTGVAPALSACLVSGLPDGVVLVDRSGRHWSGS